MSDVHFSLPTWQPWLARSTFVATKMGDANEDNLRDHFGRVHAASEALLRQVLFVGLRLNKVTYAEASDWLFHNDATPTLKTYPSVFDRLFAIRNASWESIVASKPPLEDLWSLWLDFSKVIRNHIQHAIRTPKEESLRHATLIDQAFMMVLDDALQPVVGGRVANTLRDFNPRLPRGQKGQNCSSLAGRGKPGKRPTPAADVMQRMARMRIFVVQRGRQELAPRKRMLARAGSTRA